MAGRPNQTTSRSQDSSDIDSLSRFAFSMVVNLVLSGALKRGSTVLATVGFEEVLDELSALPFDGKTRLKVLFLSVSVPVSVQLDSGDGVHQPLIDAMALSGARRPVQDPMPPVEMPPPVVAAMLTDWFNRAANAEDSGLDPQVRPSLDECMHADVRRIARLGGRLWLDQLSVDPRNRIASANGGTDLKVLSNSFLPAAERANRVQNHILDLIDIQAGQVSSRDPLNPVIGGPENALPLAARLTEMAPHLMLPGIEAVPDNAVVMLETNPVFIATDIVRANHQMTREMKWQGLDAVHSATVFHQFLDVRGGAMASVWGGIDPIIL